jgi:hypothetical protein
MQPLYKGLRPPFEQVGANRVEVKGRAPTTTYDDGFRAMSTLMIGGFEAECNARPQGEAIIYRARRLIGKKGRGAFEVPTAT